MALLDWAVIAAEEADAAVTAAVVTAADGTVAASHLTRFELDVCLEDEQDSAVGSQAADTSVADGHCPVVTRYGYAIKALPKGAKPFGQEDDENEETPELETSSSGASNSDTSLGPMDELSEDPTAAPASATEDPAVPPAADAPPEREAAEGDPGAALGQSDDDSRPWAGDEYNEGDETDPDGPEAWCAYAGSGGEQAWLDKAPDGTLTGWVRDSDGQVWRYTDPDAWSTDVDGAQMTQTHHNGEDRAGAVGDTATSAPPPAGDRGVQDSMFAGQ